MKRLVATLLVFMVIMFVSVPVFATPAKEVVTVGKEVLTFGYTYERNRVGTATGPLMGRLICHFGGPSYSQPLLINGDHWGGELAGRTVAVTVEDNVMYGYLLPEGKVPAEIKSIELIPEWALDLSGTAPTKSHPTFYEKGGRKYLFIGTSSDALNVVDATDFLNINDSSIKTIKGKHITDIVSSPLVLDWRGHDIVLVSSGNTAKYYIIADPLDSKKNIFYIDCASYGRTSSSPVPVDYGKGFAVGVDQGRSKGQIQIYYLDDILEEGSDGRVRLKSNSARIAKNTYAGVASSPVVEGNLLYFGDTQSNIYAFNYKTGEFIFKNGPRHIFSNRSPAVGKDTIYFPAVGEVGGKGKLIAVDKHTGKTKWVKSFQSRAQTSPVIVVDEVTGDPFYVLEGTSEGYLALINPENGMVIKAFKIASQWNRSKYAAGVSGAVSIAGDYTLISTEQGILGYWLTDSFNFRAVSIESGLPEGQKAQKGKVYKGSAVFSYDKDSSPVKAYLPIGVFYRNKYLKLTDENGIELPKMNISDGTFLYVLGPLGRGESRKIYYTWTAAESGTLTAAVNIDLQPIINVFDEDTYSDNKVSTEVEVAEPPSNKIDLRVDYVWTPDRVFTGDTVDFEAHVVSNVDYEVNTQIVWRVNGKTVKTQNVTIRPGKGFYPWLRYTLPGTAETGDRYTVEVEVNPSKNSPASEKTWANNVGRSTFEAYKDQSEDAGLSDVIIRE